MFNDWMVFMSMASVHSVITCGQPTAAQNASRASRSRASQPSRTGGAMFHASHHLAGFTCSGRLCSPSAGRNQLSTPDNICSNGKTLNTVLTAFPPARPRAASLLLGLVGVLLWPSLCHSAVSAAP